MAVRNILKCNLLTSNGHYWVKMSPFSLPPLPTIVNLGGISYLLVLTEWLYRTLHKFSKQEVLFYSISISLLGYKHGVPQVMLRLNWIMLGPPIYEEKFGEVARNQYMFPSTKKTSCKNYTPILCLVRTRS